MHGHEQGQSAMSNNGWHEILISEQKERPVQNGGKNCKSELFDELWRPVKPNYPFIVWE